MLRKASSLLALLLAAGPALGCGSDDDDDEGGTAPPSDPTDPALYESPTGEALAFGVQDGDIRNYFSRQGGAAVHLLTRSGADARLIAAFPAENQGIGVWFAGADEEAQLWAGDEADLVSGGGLVPVVREGVDGERDMFGVRAVVRSDAESLTAYLTLLANVRTLRDYGYGLCLENAAELPELRNETIELLEEHDVVRVRRVQIDGEHTMELLLKGGSGTTLSVVEQEVPARESCQASAGAQEETVIEIAGGEGGLEVELVALSDDEPLTPIEKDDLLVETRQDSLELDALAFLSYAEKLQAGSWRFLTYFGRDTLLSIRMLMPGLKSAIVDAALTSVIERINLVDGVMDPNFEYTIEIGDVAHEEELGDFAAWKNQMEGVTGADLGQRRHDYKMVDDDFLLAPVLVEFMDKVAAEDPDGGPAAIEAFLDRTRPDGRGFRDAVLANLGLVVDRARPFADDPAAPAEKVAKLVALKNTVPVGQWRDSDMGIGFGRLAFDVNAGLVPGALEAAATLYERLGVPVKVGEVQRILEAWRGVEELFLTEISATAARANAADYAASVEVTDTSAQIEPEQAQMVRTYGIALDADGAPVPVMHTDHGLVMEFARPSDEYLVRVARTIARDFPAGLMSPVGVMVANPALAPPTYMVTNPGDLRDPDDDVQVPLRDIFTTSHYHGTVVWSWQQAMLASGMRRQIERLDIADETRAALERAECKLWDTIDAAEEVRAGELWSWEPTADGRPEVRAFGFNRNDVDESNAIQLWSTVYLVVVRPGPEVNPLCAETLIPPVTR